MLHALCRVLGQAGDTSERAFVVAKSAYEMVTELSWPDQIIEEKSGILGCLAYAAWNTSRTTHRYADMRLYELRCEAHAMEQEQARDFLALSAGKRSGALSSRFLSDPPVLLAAIRKLGRLVNVDPREGSDHGRQLFEWIDQTRNARSDGETVWFACRAAIATAGSLRHLGEISEAETWLKTAEAEIEGASDCLALSLEIEYSKLTNLLSRRQMNVPLDRYSKLVDDLAGLGLDPELAKARFLSAIALKERGSDLALGAFESLTERPEISCDKLLLGLSLLHVGDLRGSRGEYELASRYFEKALPLLAESGVPWALADFHAVVAEKLRDQGFVSAAMDGYRSAIEISRHKGMSLRVSYLQVILAETLIAGGKEAEALAELVSALPVIERESLQREGVAAIALMREALTRSRLDADALRVLRTQLDRLK